MKDRREMVTAHIPARRALACLLGIAIVAAAAGSARAASSPGRSNQLQCHVSLQTLAPPTATMGLEHGDVNGGAPPGVGAQHVHDPPNVCDLRHRRWRLPPALRHRNDRRDLAARIHRDAGRGP
jgi:hypothetical protein